MHEKITLEIFTWRKRLSTEAKPKLPSRTGNIYYCLPSRRQAILDLVLYKLWSYANNKKMARSWNVKVEKSFKMFRFILMKYWLWRAMKSSNWVFDTITRFPRAWSVLSNIIYKSSIAIKVLTRCIKIKRGTQWLELSKSECLYQSPYLSDLIDL